MKRKKTSIKEKFSNFLIISFYVIIKPICWFYAVVFQHVRFKKNGYKVPKGSVLFLSNHLTNWDGIYINCMFWTRIIRCVCHDEMFKNKALAWIFKNLLGEICRGKKESDFLDVLKMKRLVSRSKVSLGLYPEGDIDMFGRTLPFDTEVAKLAKLLKIPVVLTKIQGAHIRAPRWAKNPRHAHITYSMTDVISVEEVSSLSCEQLFERIYKGIANDDSLYQQSLKHKQFPTKNRANWLELGIFYCPNCGKFETLSTKNDLIYCKECGFKARYNVYSALEQVEGKLGVELVTEWDDLQKAELYKRIDQYDGEQPFLQEENLTFYRQNAGEYFKKPLGSASLKVYGDRIEYSCKEERHCLYVDQMTKISLQYKDVLEIHYGDYKIRFQHERKKWSAYLYVLALKRLKEAQNKVA